MSNQIGMGHLVRCLDFANHSSEKGVNSIFFTSSSSAKEIIDDKNFECLPNEKNYKNALKEINRVWIPKQDGSQRPLGKPTLRDRVAQMAVKLVIEPIFEADFCDNSYGFRPQKSAHEAVDSISDSLNYRYIGVIDADLSKYFDTIPHAKLMAVVAERIVDGAISEILQKWFKATVIEENENGK